MYIGDCQVRSNLKISEGIFLIELYCPDICSEAEAGQFVHIKVSEGYYPLLRRPLSINSIDIQKGCFTLLYKVLGKGTQLLTEKKENDAINIIGPLGKGFPILKDKRTAIVGGGVGIAPLLELSKHLKSPDIYLGYKDCTYMVEEFSKFAKILNIFTEDGNSGIKGFPTQLLKKNIGQYDVVYTCGPKAMMRSVKGICEDNRILCYVSMEENMGCGIGACLTCSCKTNSPGKYKRVCIDGPVFDSKEVILND